MREIDVDPPTLTSAATAVAAAEQNLSTIAHRAHELAAVPMTASFPAAPEGLDGAQMWEKARSTFADGLAATATALGRLQAGLSASASGYQDADQAAVARTRAADVDLPL